MLRYFAVFGLLMFCGGLVLAVPSGSPTDSRLKLLVEQLLGDDVRKREDAFKSLEEIGESALEPVKNAVKSAKPDQQKRAKELIAKIEAKLASSRLLEPTWINLDLKEVPISKAIEELEKQSGRAIQVTTVPKDKLSKKISIQTGKVPYWTALEKLCEVAELKETDVRANARDPLLPRQPLINRQIQIAPVPVQIQVVPAQVVPDAPEKPAEKKEDKKAEPQKEVEKQERKEADKKEAEKKEMKEEAVQPKVQPQQLKLQIQAQPVPIQIQGGGQIIQGQGGIIRNPAAIKGGIQLIDGKPESVPTHIEGAFRIRVLGSMKNQPNATPLPENEIGLLMQVQADPRLTVVNVKKVTITSAVDNQKQNLKYIDPIANIEAEQPVQQIIQPNGAPIQIRPAIARINPTMGVGETPFPIRFEKSKEMSKSIEALTGTVTVSTRLPATALIEVEQILAAKNEVTKGKESSSLLVKDIRKGADGAYELDLEVNLPTSTTPLNTVTVEERTKFLEQNRQKQLNGGGIGLNNSSNHGIELLDDKGNRYEFQGSKISYRIQNTNRTSIITIRYAPKKDQGDPEKLVLTGTQTVDLDVPFTLKSISLEK